MGRINSNNIHMPPKGSTPSSHYIFTSTFVQTSFTNEIPIAQEATHLIQTSQILLSQAWEESDSPASYCYLYIYFFPNIVSTAAEVSELHQGQF